jgi:U6 snRNA-associated Sm-like protein LSm7
MNKGGAPKKNSILELGKLMDAAVRVKCLGGRELQGTLRGYDELVNLVLDDCDEFLRGKSTFISSTILYSINVESILRSHLLFCRS